jgi:methionine sulfoxide reductase heme-binding subunit
MNSTTPLHYLWWLVSRASGVVGLVLISLSVLLGLTMAAGALRRAGMKRNIARAHEHLALTALVAVGVHGLSLLGDGWLRPGLRDIAVPFTISYRPFFTGLGIIAGYLAALIGPSFYLRRRIGPARWRKLHRLSLLVWFLAAGHTVGAGSDAMRPWLRAIVISPIVPMVYLLVLRALKPSRAAGPRKREVPSSAQRQHPPRGDATSTAGVLVRRPLADETY